jgi:hypothetical protein
MKKLAEEISHREYMADIWFVGLKVLEIGRK